MSAALCSFQKIIQVLIFWFAQNLLHLGTITLLSSLILKTYIMPTGDSEFVKKGIAMVIID